MDPKLASTVYRTLLKRTSTFAVLIAGGAIATEMVLGNVIDGFYWGKNKDRLFENIPAIRQQREEAAE
ncbi:uncharacterized protein AMSG_08741 [Thecamonas trahens ATCC 50062]|uniref:Complex III subunit 9 n=1 Tax=Thecamonas trahens ATCC 50062 TaxID=461836 RepID=A0A0L0DPA2_THETB|nr:hypothetical protein AMSG_08741 [Thecamonas trahens ATCC 50062]KNC53253.1 hypothetical protein AMSG_08741 [Thecamonas trahens ATCC 50062]|eukprot:XP_013754517.1 hypothetical protein AMSG_08741 [Thecamonas trahens ATCC 50062]